MSSRTQAYVKHRRTLAKRHGHLDPVPDPAPRAKRLSHAARVVRANHTYGADLEHRAVAAFAHGALPEWFVSIRPRHPDEVLVDLWVETDRGAIPVNVKSSTVRAQTFAEEHPDITVVVLHASMEDAVVRGRVLAGVAAVWAGRGETRQSERRAA